MVRPQLNTAQEMKVERSPCKRTVGAALQLRFCGLLSEILTSHAMDQNTASIPASLPCRPKSITMKVLRVALRLLVGFFFLS